MIDKDGYRINVGIVLVNRVGHVFWGKRIGQDAWQFPQGGIDLGETPEACLQREMHEEIGATHFTVVAQTPGFLRYDFPAGLGSSGPPET